MGKVWKQQMYPQYATYYYPQYLQAKFGRHSGIPSEKEE
uniref:Isoform 4 of RNA-binding motif, single-stranded-interacting protein 1 n=1 Tax=Homo sapiens TaxID=9606 RepID=P29558-4